VLFRSKRFAEEVIGSKYLIYIPKIADNDEDNFLIRADKTPNSKGLELLGISSDIDNFIIQLLKKNIKLVYIIQDSMTRIANYEEVIKNIEIAIVHISNITPTSKKATILFPAATFAEMHGTFVNFQGRIQRIHPAVVTIEEEKLPSEFAMSRLDKFGAQNDRWTRGTKFNARPVWKVITRLANAMGGDFKYEKSEDVFDDIAARILAFVGLDYSIIGTQGAVVKEEVSVR
jgi:NADH-quinone oxidoreductase subunit G